ncbi:DUF4062 domain-containing protein, partial [Asanoa sp. NPDC050611]|uniref:DUF4062 domain-containing protein n=1 Tax=Asanoa sp. NPDC050611 TaxID=3157098 RepID=UPI0033D3EADB
MTPTILTPDQRLRVFVSSTLGELATERAAVRDAVRDLRLVPVMFEQGARPHPPREVYRAYVEQSQIFIGVYGESYGWIAPEEDISGLADELGIAAHLPRLVYVKEPAPGRDPRLTALLAAVERDGRVSYRRFGDTAELHDLVERDLALLLSERFETATATAATEVPTGNGLPVSRTPLVGRADEMAALATLVTDDDVPLVTLIGPGGIGKTRLATAVAEQVAGAFPDGVRYLDLSTVASVDLVGEAVARGLGGGPPCRRRSSGPSTRPGPDRRPGGGWRPHPAR